MAPPPRPARRVALALLRLLCLYTLFCYALLEISLTGRALFEAAPFRLKLDSPRPDAAIPARLAGVNVALEQYSAAADRRRALEQLRGAGFGWVRQRVDWGLLEPSPGLYRWAQTDGILADIAGAGLEAVVVLDGSPAWARDARDHPPQDNPFAPPRQEADFARFAAAFARRYGEQIRFYQIWDEPNIAPHWGNRWIEPVAYSRLLAETAPAIRAADADARILLAALAPTADRGHTAIDEAHFLRRLYAAGAAPHFDGVALQPFGFGLPPGDPRSRVEVLNFQRLGLIRRVMLAEGDSATPIWATAYGWNRAVNPHWQTVSPQAQQRYVQEAHALAQSWPWLVGLGWAIDRPPAPAADSLWGFALFHPDGTADPLLATFAQTNASPERRDSPTPLSGPAALAFWLALLPLLLWRGWQAAKVAGLARWPGRVAALPLWEKLCLWAALCLLYYFAVWPPLILACWLAAAILLAGEKPVFGLLLAAFLLPFHYQHKEVALVGFSLAAPPAYAALLCALPGWIARPRSLENRSRPGLSAADGLALGWLTAGLLAGTAGWHWQGTPGGLWGLTVGPLLLYALARTAVISSAERRLTAGALAAGAGLAGLLGLLLWWQGNGTDADGVRRLVGLTFSPNQTALLLVRALFVAGGLALSARGFPRAGWGGIAAVIGLALLLTGSRGALLLGLPAGGAVWLLLQPGVRRRLTTRRRLLVGGGGALLVLLLFGLGGRLLNSATVAQRLHIWQGALDLWLAHFWLGVGPGGFFWRYPAFMTAAAAGEPNLLHPHNLWLEMTDGWGVVGLAWLSAFGVWLWRRARGAGGKVNGVEAGLLAGLAAALAHAQVDTFAALPELVAWNWLVVGLLAWPGNGPQKNGPPQ